MYSTWKRKKTIFYLRHYLRNSSTSHTGRRCVQKKKPFANSARAGVVRTSCAGESSSVRREENGHCVVHCHNCYPFAHLVKDKHESQQNVTFQVRHPRCVVQNYRYKQHIVKHNSVILLRCISYIVSFNDMFRL
jgi:hypothetical protein